MTPRIETIGDCTLYLGDCLEILPTLGKVDAVVTDPPYGVGFAKWDSLVDSSWLAIARSIAPSVLLTPGVKNLFSWPAPDWTGCYSYPIGLKAAAGGKLNAWEPVLVYGRNCFPLDSRQFPPIPDAHVSGHPCPKPLTPFAWLVSVAAEPGGLILDPFMGSGTTGVACVKLGRRFVGIEIDPGYFEIACQRIRDAYAQGDLFREPPKRKVEQLRLGEVEEEEEDNP